MAEISFSVKGNGVLRVRLEGGDITGMGSPAYPLLMLPLKMQLLPLGPLQYTLLRLGGKIYVSNENDALATFENAPMAEESMSNPYDRPVNLTVPLTLTQIKHIEDLRAGGNLAMRVALTGLVALKPNNEFERLQEVVLQLSIPRSHWIDTTLKAWRVSDLRLLEVNFPAEGPKEIALAKERLVDAEQLYRMGDYPHALTALRLAFAAIAEFYSTKRAGKDMFEQMLVNTHPDVQEKLGIAFNGFYRFLHLGPHAPAPTSGVPIPISRQDVRLALVVTHAMFEYFSAEKWPGI